MIRPGRLSRALALCSLLSLLSFLILGCGTSVQPSSEERAPEEVTGRPDDRIAQISHDVILVVRHLNINNLAFLRQSLTPSKYRVALDFLIPEIQLLAQQIVAVSADGNETETEGLLGAVDPLARAAAEFSRYVDTEQDDALVEAYTQLAEAHFQLEYFLANTSLQEGPTLQELLLQAGRVEILAEPRTVSLVVLGPFSSIEEARKVQEAATFGARISPEDAPTVWLGPFYLASEARAVAAQWRERGVSAAIHEDRVYQFQATEVAPVLGRTWRELAWTHELEIAGEHSGRFTRRQCRARWRHGRYYTTPDREWRAPMDKNDFIAHTCPRDHP